MYLSFQEYIFTIVNYIILKTFKRGKLDSLKPRLYGDVCVCFLLNTPNQENVLNLVISASYQWLMLITR